MSGITGPLRGWETYAANSGMEGLKLTFSQQTGERSPFLRVLVIALNFPPDAEVGAKRIAGFCRYLPEFGIQPLVLTVKERCYKVLDETVSVPQGVRVVRTSVTNPLLWYHRLRFRPHRKPRASGVRCELLPDVPKRGFLRHQLLTLLHTPDEYWGWYLPAIRAAEKLIQTESIAAILSTAPPWTPHLIARHLKKKYRLPWLADFRDPWTSDPWRGGLPQWRQRIDRRFEASCLRWADLVICATNGIQTQFVEQYPVSPEKFVTLTNGFDGSYSATLRTTSKSSPRLLLHLGKLYGGRRIDAFCEALVNLTRSGLIDPANIKILFIGENDAAILASAQRVAPELVRNSCVEFRPRVPWGDAQRFLDKADILLIFQGDNHLSVPAKFYEYLRTGKPIFAMVKQGELSAMLNATSSGVWADPRDPKDIASKLVDVLNMPTRSLEEIDSLAELYHLRSLTKRLASWIRHCYGQLPGPSSCVSQ